MGRIVDRSSPSPKSQVLLSDANVLIDYRDSDPTVLLLVSEHVGPVCVLRQVLEETKGAAALKLTRARQVATKIHENNPFHITKDIIARFKAKLVLTACQEAMYPVRDLLQVESPGG